MERSDLTATSLFTSKLVAFALVGIGVLFVGQFDWLGWSSLVDAIGGESRLLSVGIGGGFFVLAALSLEKNALRTRCAELMQTLHQLLYGKDYRAEREMIDVLIKALESDEAPTRENAHAHLVRLTGLDMAADPAVWRAWWGANQRHFSLAQGGGRAAGEEGSSEGSGDPPDLPAEGGEEA